MSRNIIFPARASQVREPIYFQWKTFFMKFTKTLIRNLKEKNSTYSQISIFNKKMIQQASKNLSHHTRTVVGNCQSQDFQDD